MWKCTKNSKFLGRGHSFPHLLPLNAFDALSPLKWNPGYSLITITIISLTKLKFIIAVNLQHCMSLSNKTDLCSLLKVLSKPHITTNSSATYNRKRKQALERKRSKRYSRIWRMTGDHYFIYPSHMPKWPNQLTWVNSPLLAIFTNIKHCI